MAEEDLQEAIYEFQQYLSDQKPPLIVADSVDVLLHYPADFVAAVRDGHADAVLAASIFHRRIHSIGAVKEAMAAAGLPVRLVPGAAA